MTEGLRRKKPEKQKVRAVTKAGPARRTGTAGEKDKRMYKVLVIGCGGSGAKTLAYMMDQLRADLAVYGISEIPGCWQFRGS